MIKYILGGILVAFGFISGITVRTIYQDRIGLLTRFLRFIQFCESEVNYYKTEFNTIIAKFRQNNNKYDAYIFDKKPSFLLKNENKKLIDDFINDVGKYDEETQKNKFCEARNQIECALKEANVDLEKKGKTFKKLAPIIAFGLFILLL